MRSIVVCCLLLSSLTANAGSWVYVTTTEDGIKFYVQGTKKKGAIVTTWVLNDFQNKQYVGSISYKSNAMKMIFDCNEETFTVKSVITYNELNAKGGVVSSDDYIDDTRKSIPPNSTWQAVMTFVCK